MAYQPTTVSAANKAIARRVTLSGEKEVYLSYELAYEIATIDIPATNSGVLTLDSVNTLPATGADLVAVVDTQLDGTTAPTFSFVGTDQNDAAMTGTATFTPPGWVVNTAYSFSEGYAVDIVPTVDGKMWKTIGLITVAGTVVAGGGLRILRLPTIASYQQLGCITNMDFQLPFRPPISIPCGMDSRAGGVKRGRQLEPTCNLTHKDKGVADGLARVGGRSITLRVDTNKEGVLVCERLIFGNWICNPRIRGGDGNDEATQEAEGMYEYFAGFSAG